MQARTSHTVSLKTGDDIKLQCDADGYPSPNITWVNPYFALTLLYVFLAKLFYTSFPHAVGMGY